MTADHTHCPTCVVCRRRLEIGEAYLVRYGSGEPRAVHQHVCFPPRRAQWAHAHGDQDLRTG